MPIISIYLGGPIEELESIHPKNYIKSLGCIVTNYVGSMMASEVAMEVDKLPDPFAVVCGC